MRRLILSQTCSKCTQYLKRPCVHNYCRFVCVFSLYGLSFLGKQISFKTIGQPAVDPACPPPNHPDCLPLENCIFTTKAIFLFFCYLY